MPAAIRPARASDIDALVAIENAVFPTDRISRRSFRKLIERETAETLVAEVDGAIAGYCMVLFRRGSGVARLYSIAVATGHAGSGVGRLLLETAEDTAFEHDRLILRLEVREDNARAIRIYETNGYRRIGMEPDYYEDHAPALRYEKMLRGNVGFATTVPFYEQTADFTCGPSCLLMAMAHFLPGFVPTPVMEVRLWREATTVFMMSGPGGCEPFGLAVAAYENGLSAEILVSFYGALFLQSVRSAEKKRVMELAQVDFRTRAEDYGIPVATRSFSLDDIRGAMAEGKLAVVLVSGFLMFGKKVPHWVLAIGDDGEHIIIHDPWVETAHDETKGDAANIPIPYDVFMRMAQFGKRLRAAVILWKATERAMTWVILTGRQSDIDQFATPHKIITTRDYLTHPSLFRGARPKVINLSNNVGYQSRGYYASLLAGSRGHKVIPTVETMIDLSEKKLYEHALPELEVVLNRCRKDLGGALPARIPVFFGIGPSKAWDRFAKLLFDWFRAPALEVSVKDNGEWATIRKIGFLPLARMTDEEEKTFLESLERYTSREWRDTKERTPARYTFATLINPAEGEFAPSSIASLKHWARIAEKMGVEVEPITKKDLAKLANYDALFIRETTSISNHTYRFARRAQQEGMPVIDDPLSMIRCTNKVYLNELMTFNKVPVPPTVTISGTADLEAAAQALGFPLVLKIPDSAFSRGVKKASNFEELKALATAWLEDSDLLIAQKYIPTDYDWRVGVLGGEPLFAVHYLMAKKHWQIVNHDRNGKPDQGGVKTFTLKETPKIVIDTAVKAARCIGDGLYGVDLKETPDGVYVIEVNDNPNLDHGWENSGEKDEVWVKLTQWFLDRLERNGR